MEKELLEPLTGNSPVISSIQKLKEVSHMVTKLGEDLHQLVSALEELTLLMKMFSGFNGQQSTIQNPLALLTTLLSRNTSDKAEKKE